MHKGNNNSKAKGMATKKVGAANESNDVRDGGPTVWGEKSGKGRGIVDREQDGVGHGNKAVLCMATNREKQSLQGTFAENLNSL